MWAQGSPEQRPGGRDFCVGWDGMGCGDQAGEAAEKGPIAMLRCYDLLSLPKKEPLQGLIWPALWFTNLPL